MTEQQRQHIENKIQSGFPLSSSICMAVGFQLYKKHFLTFALYVLLIPIIGIFLGFAGLGFMGTALLTLFISPVLSAGLYLGADQAMKGEPLEFKDFFNVLPKSLQLISCNLGAIIITALVLIPTYFIFQDIGMLEWYQAVAENPVAPPEPPLMSASQSSTFFLNMIPLLYLQVGFSWAFLLILFYDTNPISALELSRRLVTKRWGAQFMLLLTFMSILMLASILLSGIVVINVGLANIATIGLFLVFPWVYCSLYVGFAGALSMEKE